MSSSVWDITPSEFPHQGKIEDKIKYWLGYAILAPSAHNIQPWDCKIQKNILKVYRHPMYTLQQSDPTLRETILSIGAFIENFCLAAQAFGYKPEVHYSAFFPLSMDQQIAEIIITQPNTGSKTKLDTFFLDAMTKRHTNRGDYDSAPVPKEIISRLELKARDIKPFLILDKDAKIRISNLVLQGVYIALSLPAMREELASLVFSEDKIRHTGMAIESMSRNIGKTNDPKKWVLHSLDPKADAKQSQKHFKEAPILVIIGSCYDDADAWLESGRLMERLLLIAAQHGLIHDISAAAVEIPTLMPQLRQEIDPDYRPQILLRLGKPLNPEFTRLSPRRSV